MLNVFVREAVAVFQLVFLGALDADVFVDFIGQTVFHILRDTFGGVFAHEVEAEGTLDALPIFILVLDAIAHGVGRGRARHLELVQNHADCAGRAPSSVGFVEDAIADFGDQFARAVACVHFETSEARNAL